jgi:hypothetical protein
MVPVVPSLLTVSRLPVIATKTSERLRYHRMLSIASTRPARWPRPGKIELARGILFTEAAETKSLADQSKTARQRDISAFTRPVRVHRAGRHRCEIAGGPPPPVRKRTTPSGGGVLNVASVLRTAHCGGRVARATAAWHRAIIAGAESAPTNPAQTSNAFFRPAPRLGNGGRR